MSVFHTVVNAELHNGATLNQAMDQAALCEGLHKSPQQRGLSAGARKVQASLATGLLIWGFIAMMGNGELAPYLLGASALLYAIQAALWIIYHPIRALVGFLLLGGLVWYGISHMRPDPSTSATSVVKKR